MPKFKRYLSPELITALSKLSQASANSNWWQDVVASKDLFLAIRGGYLNAYAQGQSIFKIGSSSSSGVDREGKPIVETHYKYLLKPRRQPEYVRFYGDSFDVEPAELIQKQFAPTQTVKGLIDSAKSYSGQEKRGVHEIARRNPSVVDLEIAFTKTGEDQKSTAPRIDLAALHRSGQSVVLRFYEVKLASDVRIRKKTDGKVEVVSQIKNYDEFLEANRGDVHEAYVDVCKTLMELKRGGSKIAVPTLAKEVADAPETLEIDTSVRLLVFGYDKDHTAEGSLFKERLAFLKNDRQLGARVFESGKPEFNLDRLGSRTRK